MATLGSWSWKNSTTAEYKINGTLVATVTGLPTDYEINENDNIEGITVTETNGGQSGTFTFSADALGSSGVKVTSASGYSYTLALGRTVSAAEMVGITATIDKGTLTITGKTTAGYSLSADGKTITYSPEQNGKLAGVTGLNKNLTTDDVSTDSTKTAAVTIADGKITLTDDAIAYTYNADGSVKSASTVSLSLSNGGNYVLAADGIDEYTAVGGSSDDFNSNGKLEITATMQSGFVFDSKKFTYKAAKDEPILLATVTGLASGTSAYTIDDETKTISLAEAAFDGKDVSLTVSNDSGYKLALADDADEDGKIGFEKGEAYWNLTSGSTVKATYKVEITAGYTLTNDKKITYTAAKEGTKAETLATISNLASTTGSNNTADDGKYSSVYGIEVEGNTITLDSTVLGTSAVKLTSTDYKLDIETEGDNKVTTKIDGTANVWVISGTTATYKTATPAYYAVSADGKSVTYTATDKGTTLATVKGVNKDLKAAYIEETDDEGKVTGGKYVLVDADGNIAIEATAEATDTAAGTIKIYGNAVNAANITLGKTDNYVFELNKEEDDGEIVNSPMLNNVSVLYKSNATAATVSAYIETGYTLSNDGRTVTCTKPSKADKTTGEATQADKIFEIKGLAKNIGDNITTLGNEIRFDPEESNVVTLTADVLGTGTVTITDSNYKLAITDGEETVADDTPMPQDSKYADVKNWQKGVDVWRISGTTASYENVIPAYYTYDSESNSVKYTSEKVNTTYVTITGFKSNAVLNEYLQDDDSLDGVKVDTKKKTITFGNDKTTDYFDELFGAKVAIDTKKFADYKFKFEGDYGDYLLKADDESLSWSVSGTTATLKGDMKGYEAVRDKNGNYTDGAWSVGDTEISQVSKITGKTLATVTGLKSGLTVAKSGNFEGQIVTTDSEGETVAADIEATNDNGKSVIKLGANVLDKGTVSIDSTGGYTLAIEDDLEPKGSGEDDDPVIGWATPTANGENKNVALKKGTSQGYVVSDDGKTVTYAAAELPDFLTTLSNVSKDVYINAAGSLAALDEDGKEVYAVIDKTDMDDKYKGIKITLPKALLGGYNDKDKITIGSNYTLELGDGSTSIEDSDEGYYEYAQEPGASWDVEGSNAVLSAYTTKGWKQTKSNEITYQKDILGSTVATLTGLKNGIELTDKGKIVTTDAKTGVETEAIWVDDNSIVLNDNALDSTKDVTLTNETGEEYTLALADVTDTKTQERYTVTPEWAQNNKGDVTYKRTTTKGYAVSDDGQTVSYKKQDNSTTTISGLKSGLSMNTEEGNSGIIVSDEDGTIELTSDVVGTSNITLKNSGKEYTFVQGENLGLPNATDTTWDYDPKKGTLSLQGLVGEGWTLSADKKSFIHTSATTVAGELASITGLKGLEKSSVTDDTTQNITTFYVTTGGSDTPVKAVTFNSSNGEIEFSKVALSNSDVKIAKGNNYTLKLADDVLTKSETAKVWRYSGTTATYKLVNQAYYTYDATKNTIKYYKETDVKGEVYATITGLSKDGLSKNFSNLTNEISGIKLDETTGTITLGHEVLGTSNIAITSSNNYKLALDETDEAINLKGDTVKEWKVSGNTASYQSFTQEYYNYNSTTNTITYSPQSKSTTLATINGIASTAKIKDGFVEGDGTEANPNVITLTTDMLQTEGVEPKKEVTLSNKSVGYVLKLADTVPAPTMKNETFKFSKSGTATLTGEVEEGWTWINNQKITYSKAQENTTLATITNISKDLTTDADVQAAIKLDTENKKIVLSEDAVKGVTKDITLGKNDLYTFDLDSTVSTPETDLEPTLAIDAKKGNVVYYQLHTPEGFSIPETGDGKTVKYSKEANDVYATISGLKKSDNTKTFYLEVDKDDPTSIDMYTRESTNDEWDEPVKGVIKVTPAFYENGTLTTKGTIEITSSEIFNSPTGKLTLGKNDVYDFKVGGDLAPESFSGNGKWTVSGNAVTLKQGQTAGYEVDTKGKTLSYVKETENSTVAEIKGLDSKKLEVSSDGTKIYVKGTTNEAVTLRKIGDATRVILNSDVLGTTNVSLTGSEDFVFYNEGIPTPTSSAAGWYFKTGTATLKQTSNAGFTLNDAKNVFTYTAGKADAALITVSGLNKEFEYENMQADDSSNPISVNFDTNVITLKKSALAEAAVTAKSNDKNKSYTFEFANDVVTEANSVTEWIYGSTATYKTYDQGYYTYASVKGGDVDKTKVNYVKATNGTSYAVISGLAKDAKGFTFDKATKVITLDEDALDSAKPKSVTVKGDAYTFAESDWMTDSDDVFDWTVSGGTATCKRELSGDSYTLSEDKHTVEYVASGKTSSKEVIKITGLNSLTAANEYDIVNNVITLKDDDLTTNTKTGAKMTKGDGYYLSYGGDSAASITSTSWNVNKGKGILSGKFDAGYRLSADKKSINYVAKDDKDVALATIAGMKSNLTSFADNMGSIDAANKVITLQAAALDTGKVTVTGGEFTIDFASDYSNSSVTGSKDCDSIKVEGSKITVNAGKGDDYVDFDSENGNVFFYASGDGNDVIANFADNDKISLSATISAENIKVAAAETDDNDSDAEPEYTDAIIVLGKGSITLTDFAGEDIHVIDKTGKETTYVWDNGCYVDQVTVTQSSASYVLEDSELSLTPTTALGKQSDTVAYSGDDKK